MIEVTDEMAEAVIEEVSSHVGVIEFGAARDVAAAVIAIVARDFRTEPRPPWDREAPPRERCQFCTVSLELHCPWHGPLASAPNSDRGPNYRECPHCSEGAAMSQAALDQHIRQRHADTGSKESDS